MRALVVLALIAALAPSPVRADLDEIAVGPEIHVPWSIGVRAEWRPFELLMPSVSIGFAPPGMTAALERGDRIAGGLALALRATTVPLPLLGLSFNLGLLSYHPGGPAVPAVELGVGWRLEFFFLEFMAELGYIGGAGVGGGYFAAGVFWIFDD